MVALEVVEGRLPILVRAIRNNSRTLNYLVVETAILYLLETRETVDHQSTLTTLGRKARNSGYEPGPVSLVIPDWIR